MKMAVKNPTRFYCLPNRTHVVSGIKPPVRIFADFRRSPGIDTLEMRALLAWTPVVTRTVEPLTPNGWLRQVAGRETPQPERDPPYGYIQDTGSSL